MQAPRRILIGYVRIKSNSSSVASQISDAVKEETAPLEMIPELLFSGPPDTFIYLLMRPKANPNERVIVPIRRKLPADFEQ